MDFELVDQLKCVECGATGYRAAEGKGGRTLMAICRDCKEKKNAEAKKDEPTEKPTRVPKGRAS